MSFIEKKSRIRDPKANEKRIFEFIKSKDHHVSQYEIQKALGMSSGAVQATIKRCLKESAEFRIYEGERISNRTNTTINIFSLSPIFDSDLNIPNLSDLHKLYLKVKVGEIIKVENNFIVPLRLEEQTTDILLELVKISPKFKNVGDLFSQAISDFLSKKIPKKLIAEAIQNIKDKKTQEDNI